MISHSTIPVGKDHLAAIQSEGPSKLSSSLGVFDREGTPGDEADRAHLPRAKDTRPDKKK